MLNPNIFNGYTPATRWARTSRYDGISESSPSMVGVKVFGLRSIVRGPSGYWCFVSGPSMERIWSCQRYWGCNCAIFCLCFSVIIMGLSNYVQLILGISETVSAVVIHDIMSDCNHFLLYVSHEIFPSFLSWYPQILSVTSACMTIVPSGYLT